MNNEDTDLFQTKLILTVFKMRIFIMLSSSFQRGEQMKKSGYVKNLLENLGIKT